LIANQTVLGQIAQLINVRREIILRIAALLALKPALIFVLGALAWNLVVRRLRRFVQPVSRLYAAEKVGPANWLQPAPTAEIAGHVMLREIVIINVPAWNQVVNVFRTVVLIVQTIMILQVRLTVIRGFVIAVH